MDRLARIRAGRSCRCRGGQIQAGTASDAEERTVDAALSGRRTGVLEAMLADPLAGRLPYEDVVSMTDELLTATRSWLPQFDAEAAPS